MRSMPDPSSLHRLARAHGSFFDGEIARARPVALTVLGNGIDITGEGRHAHGLWSYDGLAPVPGVPSNDGEAHLMHRAHPDARLVISDPAILAQLKTRAPQILGRGGPRRGALGLMVQAALIIAIIAAILFVLVPRGAGLIAGAIPTDWEAGWGKQVAKQLAGAHKVCKAEEGRAALDALIARLGATARAKTVGYQITVTVIEMPVQNAFATLGGQIIVFSKLIEKMDGPDELAGVLAHEIGHVASRHPLTGAIEATATMLFAGLFGGSRSDMGGGMASLGGVLAITSNTRAKEAAADRIAVKILNEARISTDGLAHFFRRLKRTAKARNSKALALFSTHPALGARVAELKARGAGPADTTPALAPDQWRALKRICR